jgi:tyrosinase
MHCIFPQWEEVIFFRANVCRSPNRRALSTAEKSDYISAVKCLQAKPGQLGNLFDGVRSRFDDYFAVHIDLTEQYHFTVSLPVV